MKIYERCGEFLRGIHLEFLHLPLQMMKIAFQSRCVKIAMLPLTAIGHFGIV